MAIDFSSIKKIQIPVKVNGETVLKYVKKIEDSSGATIWKGTYTITWKNYDGTTLTTSQVAYGSTPSYSGSTPTKPSTNTQVFTFSGWDPVVVAVTGDATYTAQYTASTRYYTISVSNIGTGDSNVYISSGTIKNQYEYNEAYDFYVTCRDFSYHVMDKNPGEEAAPPIVIDGVAYSTARRMRGNITSNLNFDCSTKQYYPCTLRAGTGVNTLKAKSGSNGSWGNTAAIVLVHGFADTVIYWQMVDYKTGEAYREDGYIYTYSGATTGNYTTGTGGTKYINREITSSTAMVNVYVQAQRERTYGSGNINFSNISTNYSFKALYDSYFNDGNYIDSDNYQTTKFWQCSTSPYRGEITYHKDRGTAGEFLTPRNVGGALTWNNYSPSSASSPTAADTFESTDGKLYVHSTMAYSYANSPSNRSQIGYIPIIRQGVPRVCMWDSDDDDGYYLRIEDMGYADRIILRQKDYVKERWSDLYSFTSTGTYFVGTDQYSITGKKFFLKMKNFKEDGNTHFKWIFNSVGTNGAMSAHTSENYVYEDQNLQGAVVTVECRTFTTPSIDKTTLKNFQPGTPFYICD